MTVAEQFLGTGFGSAELLLNFTGVKGCFHSPRGGVGHG